MLGRVITGDIATTLVDLSLRGLLSVAEVDAADQAEWLLRPVSAGARERRQDSLLKYERILLDVLSNGSEPAPLRSLAPQIPAAIGSARSAIIDDAVSHGWLHRFHHHQRTDAGEQLAVRIRRFHNALRRLATEQDQESLTGRLLPYALHFGLIDREQLRLGRFTQAWVDMFGNLPGWTQPPARRPDYRQPDAVAKPTIDEQLQHLDTYLFLK